MLLLQMRCVMDKDYIPNFKTAFEHFLVHTGGRAVIEEVEKKLCLDPRGRAASPRRRCTATATPAAQPSSTSSPTWSPG